MEEFELEKFLGKGSYGAVVLARRRTDGQFYAIKQITLKNLPRADRDAQLTEIRVLSQVWHPNILKIYQAFISNQQINMVLEYAPQGDLEAEIQQNTRRRKFFDEKRIWEVLLQILVALRALHKQGVLHRDVKGQNILCFSNGIVKIADFGVAKILKKGQLAHTGIGTPYFISPEVWQNAQYDAKCDVFSLGCLIYEMCELAFPFKGRDMQALGRAICRCQYAPVGERYSNDLRQLISKMLEKDAKKRFSVQQLLDSDEVRRRAALCPTTLDEQILPGLGTQRDIFGAGYSEDLGKTIQYDHGVRGALESNYQYGKKPEAAVLLDAQYDKISQMQQMTEYQRNRVHKEGNEISSAFQAQLQRVENERSHAREQMISLQPEPRVQQKREEEQVMQAQPARPQRLAPKQEEYPFQDNQQANQRRYQRFQPAVLEKRPPVALTRPENAGRYTSNSEPVKETGEPYVAQRAPAYGVLPSMYANYPQYHRQNAPPQMLPNRFQVLRPKPLDYHNSNQHITPDPQQQYAQQYRKELGYGYARRNESNFRNYYGRQ